MFALGSINEKNSSFNQLFFSFMGPEANKPTLQLLLMRVNIIPVFKIKYKPFLETKCSGYFRFAILWNCDFIFYKRRMVYIIQRYKGIIHSFYALKMGSCTCIHKCIHIVIQLGFITVEKTVCGQTLRENSHWSLLSDSTNLLC